MHLSKFRFLKHTHRMELHIQYTFHTPVQCNSMLKFELAVSITCTFEKFRISQVLIEASKGCIGKKPLVLCSFLIIKLNGKQ